MPKEYLISKLSFRDTEQLINTVMVGEVNNNSVLNFNTKDRAWIVQQYNAGNIIGGIKKNSDGQWMREGQFELKSGYFHWGYALPQNISKRNMFVSYYHQDDQGKRHEFDNLFSDLIINQSVMLNDINGENSDGYINRLINEGYMKDTTVLTVLLGPKTKCRKHIDWEIGGALNHKVGDRYAGLLGIRLPSHPEYRYNGYVNRYHYPERFIANVDSGYAILTDWTEDRSVFQRKMELAFSRRQEKDKIVNLKIPRLTNNLCN